MFEAYMAIFLGMVVSCRLNKVGLKVLLCHNDVSWAFVGVLGVCIATGHDPSQQACF